MDDYLVNMNAIYGWDTDEDAFIREIAHFVKCIVDIPKCICPVEDGVATMKILRGIYESAELGREILLD